MDSQGGYVQGNSQGAPQFKVMGDNASSQSVDERPSGGIWLRHLSGKKDKGGILQEPQIQEALTGQDELQYANHVLRALPKGLKFF